MDEFRQYSFNLGVINGTAYLCCVFAGGLFFQNEVAWVLALLGMGAVHISAAAALGYAPKIIITVAGAASWVLGLAGGLALLF